MIMVKCKYEGTGIWDGRCTGTKEVDSCPGYDKCKQYKPNYTTNADRIRAMSDEMLAEFLILSPEMEFDVCLLCQFGNPTPRDDRGQCLAGYGACDAESRAEAFKKWLKQPAEGEWRMSALHLLWIVPLSVFIGYIACGLLSANGRHDDG
jgi:hypothetical protein